MHAGTDFVAVSEETLLPEVVPAVAWPSTFECAQAAVDTASSYGYSEAGRYGTYTESAILGSYAAGQSGSYGNAYGSSRRALQESAYIAVDLMGGPNAEGGLGDRSTAGSYSGGHDESTGSYGSYGSDAAAAATYGSRMLLEIGSPGPKAGRTAQDVLALEVPGMVLHATAEIKGTITSTHGVSMQARLTYPAGAAKLGALFAVAWHMQQCGDIQCCGIAAGGGTCATYAAQGQQHLLATGCSMHTHAMRQVAEPATLLPYTTL